MTVYEFPVEGLGCASCVSRVEKALASVPGVSGVSVSLVTSTASVECDESVTPQALRDAVRSAGYDLLIPEFPEEMACDAPEDPEVTAAKRSAEAMRSLRDDCFFCIIFGLVMMLIEMGMTTFAHPRAILVALASIFVFYFARRFHRSAWKQLRHGSANMDTLVSLSVIISYLFSLFNMFFPDVLSTHGLEARLYFSSCAMIVTFVNIGRALEEKAKLRTYDSLEALKGLQPQGEFEAGKTVGITAGDRVPVDGTVLNGTATADESMLTGESSPVVKNAGDPVFAGTVLLSGSVEVLSDKVGGDTVLAGMIDMVRNAQSSKPKIQKTVDKVAAVFVPVILAVAIITCLIWSLSVPDGFAKGLLASVSVLVIACPCSLGLATPTAMIAAVGNAARHGILVKDADALTIARRVHTVVLDKTGTLTEGVAGADVLRPGAADAVASMKRKGLDVVMLSGDNKERAEAVAAEAGIDIVHAEVCHEFKAAFVKGIQAEGGKVAMVGDGVNDSAALAYSDLSVAMGSGSDVAMDTAMCTIISSDLGKLNYLMELSARTERIVRENLFWAFIYNVIAVPVAAMGKVNPMIAAACMAASSICVVCNSLRLRK